MDKSNNTTITDGNEECKACGELQGETPDSSEQAETISSNSTSSKTGYVMVLDVLGFRDTVSKYKADEFIELWKETRGKLIRIKKGLFEWTEQVVLDILFMSDTIIICASLENNARDNELGRRLIFIFPTLIDYFFMDFFQKNFYLRGAISYGSFRYDADLNIVMGEALDEAYE
jgi:hypothetical protein